MASHPSSAALRAHAESVVKKGFPDPELAITIVPSSRYFLAEFWVYRSKNSIHSASSTSHLISILLRKFLRVTALKTVESMLILCESAAFTPEAIRFEPL